MLLLTGAGLLVRSLSHLEQVEVGFQPKQMMSGVISLPVTKYKEDAQQAAFFAALDEQLRVQMRQELRRKGVDRDVIDAVLEESEHAEDKAALQAALARAERYRQLPRQEFVQKLSAYLARRGFDYETVREAVQAAWQAVHARVKIRTASNRNLALISVISFNDLNSKLGYRSES